ncbi:MAG: hypothetical protein U5Q16_09645 [Gammaproteobacteria bacterium]|nr:hypothetical protein [Gammaproteobacteria bacterium]
MRNLIPLVGVITLSLGTWPLALHAQSAETPAMPAEDIDRELIVRFSRAYGMAQGALKKHDDDADNGSLQEPESLDGGLTDEVRQIMEQNGVSRDEWQGLMARMAEDEEFRQRVESLSTPFRYD